MLTGLSKVSVNQIVARLLAAGELSEGELIASGGGRPARLYSYRAQYASVVMLSLRLHGALILLRLELLNLEGEIITVREGRFAHLEAGSFDSMLDALALRSLSRIVVVRGSRIAAVPGLREQLRQRYGCDFLDLQLVAALAESREGSLSICIQRGEMAEAILYSAGRFMPAADLSQLPLPSSWLGLDYSDHTLVEEMVARLLQMLVCILAPQQIILYGDCWTERLKARIQFNLTSKLQRRITLDFRPMGAQLAELRLRRAAVGL